MVLDMMNDSSMVWHAVHDDMWMKP